MMLETQVPLRELEQLYTLRKPDEVIKFIGDNAFLIPLLRNAPEQIRRYFPGAPLFLELFIDYDYPKDRNLVILLESSYAPQETSVRFYQLEENLWEDLWVNSNFKLSLNIEYK
jgi:hypothetical protein